MPAQTSSASRGPMEAQNARLEAEIVNLLNYIRRFRDEIAHAQLASTEGDNTRFQSMSEQLDAIVQGTEQATHSILERIESVDGLADEIREADDRETRDALCDRIHEETTQAMEACTFQDIAGQRVTKIVRSMEFVEERIDSIVDLWGADAIKEMASQYATKPEDAVDEEKGPLEGPALPGDAAISQDEIDKLFD